MLNDNVQEECPIQKFEYPVGEEVKEVHNGNQEQVSENAEEDQKYVTNQEEGMNTLEQNQSFTNIKEGMTEVPVPVKSKADNVQISNEKLKGKSVVTRLKVDVVQLLVVKFQRKFMYM